VNKYIKLPDERCGILLRTDSTNKEGKYLVQIKARDVREYTNELEFITPQEYALWQPSSIAKKRPTRR
jgi:hypothetical protein